MQLGPLIGERPRFSTITCYEIALGKTADAGGLSCLRGVQASRVTLIRWP